MSDGVKCGLWITAFILFVVVIAPPPILAFAKWWAGLWGIQ